MLNSHTENAPKSIKTSSDTCPRKLGLLPSPSVPKAAKLLGALSII